MRKIRHILLWASAMVLVLTFRFSAIAEEKSVSVTIPVSVSAQGCSSTFCAVVTHPDSPYVSCDKDRLLLKDGETGCLNITAFCPGTYEYEIAQQQGLDKRIQYDPSIYRIKIRVIQAGSGGLNAQTYVYRSGDTGKSGEVIFRNTETQKSTDKGKTTETEKPLNGQETTGNPAAPVTPKTGDDTPYEGFLAAAVIAGTLSLALSVVLIRVREERSEGRRK